LWCYACFLILISPKARFPVPDFISRPVLFLSMGHHKKKIPRLIFMVSGAERIATAAGLFSGLMVTGDVVNGE